MLRKIAVLLLAASLLFTAMIPAASATEWGTSVMYVKTENGGSVNVRSAPCVGDNIIGTVNYGDSVLTDWSYAGNDGWTKVVWGSMGDGYIMSRYLVDSKPGPSKREQEKEREQLKKELESEKDVEEPFSIVVRPGRVTGWVNFRTGPSTSSDRIGSFPDGKKLTVQGETINWYHARDPETGKVGYIYKEYTARVMIKYYYQIGTINTAQKLGTLNVNGEFELTCKLPDGYKLQVVSANGDKIIASVLSEDTAKPQLYLSIAFDESYSGVERMNDLSDEELALLESTFQAMNDVDITYRETGYGTKLLIARETGSDTDFVDILSIYKGYFVEFNMTPNPKAADQTLTDAQIQMCIDFLTDVDFTPVQ